MKRKQKRCVVMDHCSLFDISLESGNIRVKLQGWRDGREVDVTILDVPPYNLICFARKAKKMLNYLSRKALQTVREFREAASIDE